MQRLINYTPKRRNGLLLGLLPFALLLMLYLFGSELRLAENPDDKLLPSFSQMADSMVRLAFEPSKRSGDYPFWSDTLSSLYRLSMGVFIAGSLGLAIGLLTGALPLVRAGFSPLLTVISLVPPLALLPILFIVFGLGEVSKIALIAIGITPFIARDIERRTREIPHEQIVKAQTLGANTSQVLIRVLLPQIMLGCGLVIFNCRRSDCLYRRPWLPHFFSAPLYVDGCDIALCGVDYLTRVCCGYCPWQAQRKTLPLA